MIIFNMIPNVTDFDDTIFTVLWSLVMDIIEYGGIVWNFLNKPLYIGFEIPYLNFGITFLDNVAPIDMLFGAGLTVLFIVWFIRG